MVGGRVLRGYPVDRRCKGCTGLRWEAGSVLCDTGYGKSLGNQRYVEGTVESEVQNSENRTITMYCFGYT